MVRVCRDLVNGIFSNCKSDTSLLGSNRGLRDGAAGVDIVRRDIPCQVARCCRVWLDSDGTGAANSRGQHRIAADICSNVEKKVSRAKHMQDECHVNILMQTTIDVAGSARHSAAHNKFGTSDPREIYLAPEPANKLPFCKARDRRDRAPAVHRVPKNKVHCGRDTHESLSMLSFDLGGFGNQSLMGGTT